MKLLLVSVVIALSIAQASSIEDIKSREGAAKNLSSSSPSPSQSQSQSTTTTLSSLPIPVQAIPPLGPQIAMASLVIILTVALIAMGTDMLLVPLLRFKLLAWLPLLPFMTVYMMFIAWVHQTYISEK